MKLKFSIDETTYSLPILREGFSLNKRVGKSGRHASASSSFMLKSCDETNLILVHDGNLDAQIIEDDGTVIQTGLVRPYLSAGYRGTFREHVFLELIDYSEKLKEYVWAEPENEADKKEDRVYPEDWIDTTLRAVVSWLFDECGVSYDIDTLQDRPQPFFALAEGQNLSDVIDELLYGYGYDYEFDADGVAFFIETFPPDLISGNITDIRGDVSLSRGDDTSDGIVVTYGIASKTNTIVFSDNNKFKLSTFIPAPWGSEGLHGYYYNGYMHDYNFDEFGKNPPTGRTIDRWDYSRIKGEDGNQIPSSDVYKLDVTKVKSWLTSEKGVKLSNHLVEYDLNGATFYVEYDGQFDEFFGNGWGFHTEIYADVTYRLKSTNSYSIDGPNPEKVDLKYCILVPTDDQYARDFAERFYKRQRNGKISVSFRSLVPYEAGGFYNMAGRFPGVSGLSMAVRVTSVSMDADGIYDIEAECCSGLSVTGTVSKKAYGTEPIVQDFGGIFAGGYDEDGNNETDGTGAYISPDGEAKFNTIIIEGDRSSFKSSVMENFFSGESIEIGSGTQRREPYQGIGGALIQPAPSAATMALWGLSGKGSFVVSSGSMTFTDSAISVAFAPGDYLIVTAYDSGTTRIYTVHKSSSMSPDDISQHISMVDRSGHYYGPEITYDEVVLSNEMSGLRTMDIMPMGDGRHSIRGFDVVTENFYSNGLSRMFQPIRVDDALSHKHGWHMLLPGGYAMQWGVASANSAQGSIVVYLPIEMADTDYMVQLTVGDLDNNGTDTDGYDYAPGINFKRTDVISITTAKSRLVNWLAIGKIKES